MNCLKSSFKQGEAELSRYAILLTWLIHKCQILDGEEDLRDGNRDSVSSLNGLACDTCCWIRSFNGSGRGREHCNGGETH